MTEMVVVFPQSHPQSQPAYCLCDADFHMYELQPADWSKEGHGLFAQAIGLCEDPFTQFHLTGCEREADRVAGPAGQVVVHMVKEQQQRIHAAQASRSLAAGEFSIRSGALTRPGICGPLPFPVSGRPARDRTWSTYARRNKSLGRSSHSTTVCCDAQNHLR